MAQAKTMELVGKRALGANACWLDFDLPKDLEFAGSQFLIVDTGLRLQDGSPVKRCFSISSPDTKQRSIELAILKVGDGTRALADLPLGAEVTFSGPWGKLSPGADDPLAPALVVATDSGITSALGLLRGRAMGRHLKRTTFLWLDHGPSALLPRETGSNLLPAGLGRFETADIPAVGSPGRAGEALRALEQLEVDVTHESSIWLMGDGDLLHPIKESLLAKVAGLDPARVRLECFFNNPNRR